SLPWFLCAIPDTRANTHTAREPCTSREEPASGVRPCAWAARRRSSELPSYPETAGGGVHGEDRQTPRETASGSPLANARGSRRLEAVLAGTRGSNRAQ